MMSRAEQKLEALGLSLPPGCPSRAMFRPFRKSGNLLFLAGQICEWNGEPRWFGPVTAEASLPEMQKAAELCALNLIYCARDALDDLDRVTAVIRLGGFVSAEPGYPHGPAIIDGASRLFIELFGDAGHHARTAVCVTSLPANAAVEVDAILEFA